MSRRSVRVALVISLCLLAAQGNSREVTGTGSPTIDPRVMAALARDGEVCVVVSLKDRSRPDERRLRRHALYRADQRAVLRTLPDAYDLRYRFRCSPVVVLATRSTTVLRALEASPLVESVRLDLPGTGALEESRGIVRADEVFDGLGLTGAGRVVAVLDSGVEADHPDLAGAVIHEKTFLDQGFTIRDEAPDRHGHGTHVTGIVASRGEVSPRGIASGVSIVAVRVLDAQNSGWMVDWAAGIEHVLAIHEEDNGISVDAINMSIVTIAQFRDDTEDCETANSALTKACQDALELGVPIFAASGNTGSVTRMSLPACLDSVVSVGSVDGETGLRMSEFTSRNRELDLVAPGEDITSAGLGGSKRTRSGTSQATPQVTAAAAILHEIEPSIRRSDLLATLIHGATAVHDPLSDLTFPRLDVLGAAMTLLTPEVTGLACSYDPARGSVRASWDPLAGLDHVVEVEIRQGETSVFRDVLPAPTTAFEFPEAVDGALYELCLNGARSGFSSPQSCCSVVASDRQPFIRGDCGRSGQVNITDAVQSLDYLFVGALPSPSCLAACDSNDDERIDVSDPVYLLNSLFRGGPAVPGPHPECGPDDTPALPGRDLLSCNVSGCDP